MSDEGNRAIALAARKVGDDWDRFCALAQRHHLVILANQRLCEAGVAASPKLQTLANQYKRRALQHSAQATRLIATLEGAGYPVALIKGPLLSQQIYGDLAMRQCIDIDLLVDWADFRGAIDTLRAQGYELLGHEPPWDDWRIEPWRELAKDVTLVHPDDRTAIELHHRLKTPASLLPGLGITQATEREMFGGQWLRAFQREDLFVYLCVHAATSLWDRLKWLADLRALLAGIDEVEIAQWQEHSASLGTERCTALGLVLCHRLWGQPIPQDILNLARSAPWLADLERASLLRLRSGERGHTSIANSLDRGRLRELRTDSAYRKAQWRELVYDHELLETVRLPRALRAFYLPLRVLLFIRRKLGLWSDPRMAR